MPTARKRSRRQSALPRDDRTRAVAAALRIAADEGWNAASLDRIAAEAELSLEALQAMFPSRAALLVAFVGDIDRGMLARAADVDGGDSPRDRLFGVLMARLDALRPYRNAVTSIARAAPLEPATACALVMATRRSLAWMLAAAGISHTGIDGALRIKGLGVIFASTLWAWSRDDSEDSSATMAHLDRQLLRAEKFLGVLQNIATPHARTARA
ncbi:MAG: TetR family transcriptional regulator [Alphaproteobacteria bacterium]|nr:TetR family transcriptional regulator [Alphaproteobacteria bacterium]